MTKIDPDPQAVDLVELVGIFYPDGQSLAEFEPIEDPEKMPQPYRGLLDHQAHMTVTVESFHGTSVNVSVQRTKYGVDALTGTPWYAREILLKRQSDNAVVQYGIVKLNFELLAPEVWTEIKSEKIPLGRVLINHDVLREVELCRLWKVIADKPLAHQMAIKTGELTYGRTARIFCDYLPAIELLEIVTIGDGDTL